MNCIERSNGFDGKQSASAFKNRWRDINHRAALLELFKFAQGRLLLGGVQSTVNSGADNGAPGLDKSERTGYVVVGSSQCLYDGTVSFQQCGCKGARFDVESQR